MTLLKHRKTCGAILLAVLSAAYPLAVTAASEEGERFDVRKIPPGLRDRTDAMIRIDSVRFEVEDERNARLEVFRAVTIFRKGGRGHGSVHLSYDDFRSIKDLDGWLYDAEGREVRTLDDADIKDESAISGYTLYEDARRRKAEMFLDTYPYTVVFRYAFKYKGLLWWPDWVAQPGDEAVERSRFELVLPKEEPLRVWSNRDSLKPKTWTEDDKRHVLWEADLLPELSREEADEELLQRTWVVKLAPARFALADTRGDMSTWKQFGLWAWEINKGRTALPEAAKQDVRRIVQNAATVREKAEGLYKYLQGRTRYVAIQLGIGGWQCFDAQYVHERGYGDCKALSNYMIALLQEAGCVGYPVLVRTGRRDFPLIRDFPNQEFNHVIVCVPDGRDSIWLECTSNTMPFGHLSRDVENHDALLFGPEGGAIVHTPASRPRDNLQCRNARLILSPGGNADCSVTTRVTGDQQDVVSHALAEASPRDTREWILNDLDFRNATLESCTIDGLKEHNLQVSLTLRVSVPRFATRSNERMFFQPNAFERMTYVPKDFHSRRSPFRVAYPHIDTDTVSYVLPEGYAVETLPEEVQLSSAFGSFHTRVAPGRDGTLLYVRRLEFTSWDIPASVYTEFRKFMMDVVKADRMQVVLKSVEP